VSGVKGGEQHRVVEPSKNYGAILLNSVAFLRRMLRAEGFPMELFDE
jgi:hypothetical protein